MRPLSGKLAGPTMNMTKKIRRLLGKSKHLLFSRNLDAGAPEAVTRKEETNLRKKVVKVVENRRKGSRRRRKRERTGEDSTVGHFTRCTYIGCFLYVYPKDIIILIYIYEK